MYYAIVRETHEQEEGLSRLTNGKTLYESREKALDVARARCEEDCKNLNKNRKETESPYQISSDSTGEYAFVIKHWDDEGCSVTAGYLILAFEEIWQEKCFA